MIKNAIIDDTGKYRYLLTRTWDENLPPAVFVMLNPSTANAEEDDPTIRRCVNFAKKWDLGGIKVVNVFAYRATNPKELFKVKEPIGIENEKYIREAVINAGIIILAWGSSCTKLKSGYRKVKEILKDYETHCLGITKDGFPKHPLYLKGTTMPKVCEFEVSGIKLSYTKSYEIGGN